MCGGGFSGKVWCDPCNCQTHERYT
jgi:hypothetical protein